MDLPKRKRIRLEGYDYSTCGAYFVTVCVAKKKSIFWDVGAVNIGSMKRWVSKQIGVPVWQKSFHDHIIRNERGYWNIWR